MTIILSKYNDSNNYNIISKKKDLDLCKKKIKYLEAISLNCLSNSERYTYETNLKVELRKKEILQMEITQLGYTEKRGRPRKNYCDKYSNNRKKFTAMLLPESFNYLKNLKAKNKIRNISAFLDELIKSYKESYYE